MKEPVARHAVIAGRVHGVWYRAWCTTQARTLGLAGWVRNRSDGTVEAVFCGSASAVEAMIERCAHGPPLARVDTVEVQPCAIPSEAGFFKRATV